MFHGIDLYSDTITRPSREMRLKMLDAEVGDEQKGEDPTTLKLEARMAEVLGHTSAMFFPSATMANEVAIRLHCNPGDELVAAHDCHLFFAETGGPAVHSGVMCKPILTPNGIFSGEDVVAQYRHAKGSHYPVTRLVSVENTTNMGGGVTWKKEELQSVRAACRNLKLKTHMDGARLFNASVASGLSPKDIAEGFDTVTVCFSKGLGCATGAILAFDKSEWEKIRWLKQLFGGAMRQSGILSAAALYALDNHVECLAQDHANARTLAKILGKFPVLEVENPVPSTNMVFMRWRSKLLTDEQFLKRCEEKGLRFSHVGPNRFRAVTHRDISKSDIERVEKILGEVCR